MGASQTKNVASAVSNVVTNVKQTTSVDAEQASSIKNIFTTNNCVTHGNLDIKNASDNVQSSKQITAARQSSSVRSQVAQQAIQKAISKVGSLGVGYAGASNSASLFASESTNIANSIFATANQYASTDNITRCVDSTVYGNFDVANLTSNKFLSEQTVNNDQAAQVVNSVTQKLDQTAKATVEGLAGFLIGLALVIAAVGFALAAPIGSVLSSRGARIVIVTIVAGALVTILAFLYTAGAPPFFDENELCQPNNRTFDGKCKALCVDVKPRSVVLDRPPLRYEHPVLDGTPQKPSLLEMVVAAYASSGNNGGYNGEVYDRFGASTWQYPQKWQGYVSSPLPNPLALPNNKYYQLPTDASKCSPAVATVVRIGDSSIEIQYGTPRQCGTPMTAPVSDTTDNHAAAIAMLNTTAWREYLHANGDASESEKRESHARLVLLAHMQLGESTNLSDVYMRGYEQVAYYDTDGVLAYSRADAARDKVYHFDVAKSTLTGPFGICDNRAYHLHQITHGWGAAVLVGLIVLALLFVLLHPGRAVAPRIRA
jgi:hypothetical protein